MTSPETTFPRNGLVAATLQFPRGLTNLSTEVGDTGDHLVIASFTGPQPELGRAGDIVSIRYPHNREQTTGRLTIADDVAWTFDIHKGVSNWNLDVRNGVVTGLRSDGGATAWALRLPDPEREVSIEIRGGVTDFTLTRPPETGVALEIDGGASNLQFDNQRFDALGPTINLEAEPDNPARKSYRIRIAGGATRLRISKE